MNLMPLTTFGAQVTGQQLTFGLLLPWVTPANGQSVTVKVIHENDQFLQRVPPVVKSLNHSVDPAYGDFWSGTVDLTTGAPAGSYWARFFNGGQVNLIQCAEKLDDPVGILYQSFSNCCWQNGTLCAASDLAAGRVLDPGTFGLDLSLFGYPAEVTQGTGAASTTMPKTAVQYLENHDHARFLCNFGTVNPDAGNPQPDPIFFEGDRSLWYKLQPYLIALLTAAGIPLLWHGQEFGENYTLPLQGIGRTMLLRPVRWDCFYDTAGQYLVHLVRALLQIRRSFPSSGPDRNTSTTMRPTPPSTSSFSPARPPASIHSSR